MVIRGNAAAFGTGSFVGEIQRNPEFFDLPVRDQALELAWADSCPVAIELTDPENTAPGRGPEAMLNRYAQINFWFGDITRLVAKRDEVLFYELTAPRDRLAEEPVGKYEPESVPAENEQQIAPLGQLAGYALPRIFVEALQKDDPQTVTEHQDNLVVVLDVLDDAITQSCSALELLARFGEGLLEVGVEPEKILKHTFSKGWIEEHNTFAEMEQFQVVCNYVASNLATAYLEYRDKMNLA